MRKAKYKNLFTKTEFPGTNVCQVEIVDVRRLIIRETSDIQNKQKS